MATNQTRTHLLFALRRILISLARLLIRIGIRFEEFDTIARDVYVESAIHDIAHHNIPSQKRIAILTGLSRRQVNQCIEGGDHFSATDPTLRSLLVEVLHKWHTAYGYGGPYGIPLELEFSCPADRCIRSLVALVNQSVDPQVILDELLRSGSVLRAGERRYRPASRFFMMPDPTSPALIEAFGMTLSRLSTTLEYNMDAMHSEKRLERRVHADRGLPLDLVPEFESYARSKATRFLMELDNWLATHAPSKLDAEPCGRPVETGVNVCLYIEPPLTEIQPLTSLVTPD